MSSKVAEQRSQLQTKPATGCAEVYAGVCGDVRPGVCAVSGCAWERLAMTALLNGCGQVSILPMLAGAALAGTTASKIVPKPVFKRLKVG